MKRLFIFVCMLFPLSVFATDTCPAGYQPAEYIELEYIESTGTQYIDTNTKPQADDVFEINYAATVIDTRYRAFLGAANDGRSEDFYISLYINSGFFFNCGFTKPNINEKWKYKIELKQNTYSSLSINDSSIIIYSESYWQDDNLPVLLFARNTTEPKAIGRLYDFCWMRNNNTLVRDFIPVRRLSDGAVGMFDRVEGKFYGNDGTGEFIAGPEIEASQSFITDENGDIVCVSCPANTYKPNAGNEQCTKCPDHTFSPVGSTALGDCAKILRVKDYVVYMPLGKRTEHGLCVMSDGKKYCADVYERQ